MVHEPFAFTGSFVHHDFPPSISFTILGGPSEMDARTRRCLWRRIVSHVKVYGRSHHAGFDVWLFAVTNPRTPRRMVRQRWMQRVHQSLHG